MRKQPDGPEMQDVDAHLQQRRHPDGAPEDEPVARDTDAPQQDFPNVHIPKFAFGPRNPYGNWNH